MEPTDFINSFDEEQKHYVYARFMGLTLDRYSFDVGGKRIVDIGGGPTSMLLKTTNLRAGTVVDPKCDTFPDWVKLRYEAKSVSLISFKAEDVDTPPLECDEVWIYNTLQYVDDPIKVVENALKIGKVVRVFEWLNGTLTKEFLDAALQTQGSVVELAESGCYGPAYYAVVQTSIDYEQLIREERPFAERMAVWFKRYFRPKKVVDIGCGPGIHVHALRNQNINAYGYDIDPRVVGQPFLQQKSMFDLDDAGDLVLCIEVAEHIDEVYADDVVDSIVRNIAPGGTLIWSAAHPGQGGVGHINCQPKSYWIDKFLARGLERDRQAEQDMLTYTISGYHMGWFISNAVVFTNPL